MGGVKVDVSGRVVGVDHLFSVGEVTGGVHGENRLGGNSLLECTVFGRIIGGESIPINQELVSSHFETVVAMRSGEKSGSNFDNKHKKISIDQVKTHATEDDCWTVIDGKVYDLSRYANEHPGGVSAIAESCGKDSTKRFLVAHSINLLDDMDFRPIGISVY
jgi:hypothetical protein